MDKGLIPNRYAKALYQVGEERSCNDALYAIMQRLAQSFEEVPRLAKTMANPFVSAADKTALLTKAVYGDDTSASNATFIDFIHLLEQNGRLDLAWDIARAYIDLYRKLHSIYKVVITSAAPLGEAERRRLTDLIQRHIGNGSAEFSWIVDPALIGGFTIAVNNERLDASVSSELKNLRLKLIN